MLGLIGASAISLLAMQATINAPTDAFRGCLKASSEKATKEKVAANAIDGYLRTSCGVQLDALKTAVIAFRTKNGMGRKAASDDASMTVDDYVATSVDRYQFMADFNAPKPAAAPAAPTAVAASAPAQATKPATTAIQPTPAAAPSTPKQ